MPRTPPRRRGPIASPSERPVLHLGHRAHVARVGQSDIGRDIGLAARRRQVDLGIQGRGFLSERM